jgi:hypothetical protein
MAAQQEGVEEQLCPDLDGNGNPLRWLALEEQHVGEGGRDGSSRKRKWSGGLSIGRTRTAIRAAGKQWA